MSPLTGLLDSVGSVTADPAKDRAAVLAVLWRIENSGLSRADAHTTLRALGLAPNAVPDRLRPLMSSERAKAYKRAQKAPGPPDPPADAENAPTPPYGASNGPSETNGGTT